MEKKIDRKIFAALFFAIFTAITGVGIVVPLLPVYADELGASGFVIGLIFGSFSLSRALFLPYFGKKSDEHGRKPFIAAGLALYVVTSVAFMGAASFSSIWGMIAIRFFQGFASAMILPVVFAYVGDMAPTGKEGFVMGIFNISMYSSLSLGPVLGGVVKDAFGMQAAFACMLALSLAACVLTLTLLPPVSREPRADKSRPPLSYRLLAKEKAVVGLFACRLAYTACIGVMWSFLPVHAHGVFGISSAKIGVLLMLSVLVAGLLQTPAGLLADRSDKRLLVTLGGVLAAFGMAGFCVATGFWSMFAASLILGIGGGISTPAHMAISVIEGKKTGSMGSVMALITLGHSLGMLFGAVGGGVMRDLFGLWSAYAGGGLVMLAGVLIFRRLVRG